ncbi:unnamed protein product [Laminaria digitata]
MRALGSARLACRAYCWFVLLVLVCVCVWMDRDRLLYLTTLYNAAAVLFCVCVCVRVCVRMDRDGSRAGFYLYVTNQRSTTVKFGEIRNHKSGERSHILSKNPLGFGAFPRVWGVPYI